MKNAGLKNPPLHKLRLSADADLCWADALRSQEHNQECLPDGWQAGLCHQNAQADSSPLRTPQTAAATRRDTAKSGCATGVPSGWACGLRVGNTCPEGQLTA